MGTDNTKFDTSLMWSDNGGVEQRSPFCERILDGLQVVAFVLLISAPIMLKYV